MYLKISLKITFAINSWTIVIKRINQILVIFVSLNDKMHIKVVNIKRLIVIQIPAENETMFDNTL